MFLRQARSSRTGRTYLSIVEGYWDSAAKMSRTKTVQKLGYLDELEREISDPVVHFKQMAEKMSREREANAVSLTFDLREEVATGAVRKSLGYVPLLRLYHQLGLHEFFINRSRHLNTGYNLNDIMKLLVFSRILEPGSKKRAYESKGQYFERFDFSLDDVYRSLTHISKHIEACQKHIGAHIPKRDTRTIYYDVTNYYFEIDEQDELRRKGVSKEHRPDPIMQMGLFLDADGIPISYRLYPGNTNDCETLLPGLSELKRVCEVGRVIVVADKGINTHTNIVFNLLQSDGYVYSQSVRGGHAELKEYVLDQSGYTKIGDAYRIKSRIYPREIIVTDIQGKKKRVRIDEKQLVFYSEKYARKARADREAAIAKAHELVNDPAKFSRATSHGAAKYVANLEFDAETGAVITTKSHLYFNEEKLRQEEQWDGYYAIITSELDMSDEELIETYRGLWRIEETFKVTKGELASRPVYVSREDHIRAHFLICFIALVILRLLQKEFGECFSVTQIAESLRNTDCVHLKENYYLLRHNDQITQRLKSSFGLDFTKKILPLKAIKNSLADAKRPPFTR